MGASDGSPRALAERRVCTPALAFPDAGCDAADVLRCLEGAIERTSGVAPGCALYFVIKYRSVEHGLRRRFEHGFLNGRTIIRGDL